MVDNWGINKIFLVTKNRIIENGFLNIENLLKKEIFDENVFRFVTLVRTNFPNFDSKKEESRLKITKDREEVLRIIPSVERIIHLDNPPIDVDNELEFKLNKEKRIKSREVLLNYLENFTIPYKPKLLGGFDRDVFAFESISKDIFKTVDRIENNLNNLVISTGLFITQRKDIINSMEEVQVKNL
ncbi:MAG: hypothetical protein mread185_000443 [Mycoplasmataceae bacterium]|nr:MAG: hypothetical protein mread185_000443 [Mycoplasmataceae bacterium]